ELGRSMMSVGAGAARATGSSTTDRKICSINSGLRSSSADSRAPNKAVQEAYSAQRHYATNASAVATNAKFSPSARKLASTTGVLLLHYGDLTRLDSLLAERDLNRSVPS